MKKAIVFCLCISMICGFSVPAFAIVAGEDAAPTVSVDMVFNDLTTNEIATFNITADPEIEQYANGAVGNIHHGWHPNIELPSYSPNVIIGGDGRTQVSFPRAFPYSAIGQLIMTFPNGDPEKSYKGTAWLIGPNTAVTSAHNLYQSEYGGDIVSAMFLPGQSGSFGPIAITTVTSAKYPLKFRQPLSDSVKYDWAVITLSDSVGQFTQWFDYAWYSSNNVSSIFFTVCGYNGDYQYKMTGLINDISATKLFYLMDTVRGQSGSPVYSADDYVVYGIHSRPNTDGSKNVAVRITMEVYTCIERIAEIPEINEEVFP